MLSRKASYSRELVALPSCFRRETTFWAVFAVFLLAFRSETTLRGQIGRKLVLLCGNFRRVIRSFGAAAPNSGFLARNGRFFHLPALIYGFLARIGWFFHIPAPILAFLTPRTYRGCAGACIPSLFRGRVCSKMAQNAHTLTHLEEGMHGGRGNNPTDLPGLAPGREGKREGLKGGSDCVEVLS